MQVQENLYSFGTEELKSSSASGKQDAINSFADFLPKETAPKQEATKETNIEANKNIPFEKNIEEKNISNEINDKQEIKVTGVQNPENQNKPISEANKNIKNNTSLDLSTEQNVQPENTAKDSAVLITNTDNNLVVDNGAEIKANTGFDASDLFNIQDNINNILGTLISIQSEANAQNILPQNVLVQNNLQDANILNGIITGDKKAENSIITATNTLINSNEQILAQEPINNALETIDANNGINLEAISVEENIQNNNVQDLIEKFKTPIKSEATSNEAVLNTDKPQTNSNLQTNNDKNILEFAKTISADTASNNGSFSKEGQDKKAAEIIKASDSNISNSVQSNEAKFNVNHVTEVVKSLNAPAIADAMVKNMRNGEKSFTIRLDPPELGKIEIELKMSADKKMSAILSFDNQSAFNDLSKSMKEMMQVLKDAGLDFGEDSIKFSLNDGSNFAGNTGKEQKQNQNQNSLMQFTKLKNIEEAVLNTVNIQPIHNWSNSRISIRA